MADEILTVIILTYNQKDYIEKAIKGVLEQETNFNFKVIISDDCSSDGTADIVRRYAEADKRIIPVLREKNIGAKESSKSCLRMVDTKYFAVLDGDDYWTDKTKLQQQIDLLEKHPDCTICSHETEVHSYKGITAMQVRDSFKKPLDKETYVWDIKSTPYTHTSSRVYRNIIPKDNEKILDFIAMDIFLYYYALDKGKNIYINKNMSVYNYTGSGIYSSMDDKERIYDEAKALISLDYMLDYKYTDMFLTRLTRSIYKRIFKLQFHTKNRRIIFECKKMKIKTP